MDNIKDIESIGRWVRKERKRQGLTQKELAGLIGVGERFIVDLEKGKKTAEIGKVFHVLNNLGAIVTIESRGQK